MDFNNLLSRADDEVLQDILGYKVVRILRLLDSNLATPSRLRQVLLKLYTPEDLLRNKKYRNLLVDLLRSEEADILAKILDASTVLDTFQSIKRVSIKKKSEKEDALLSFFEIYIPETEYVLPVSEVEKISPQYSLFEHQLEAACKVKHHLRLAPNRVLLHMPTGSGKTRTAMSIITDHLRSRKKTLVIWLAHSEELCEQAATEFQMAWQHLGDRELRVYRFWGEYDFNPSQTLDGVLVAGLSKIYSRTKNSIQFINKLGSCTSLVIIDEAHQAIAETYKLILDALVVPYDSTALLGLTATPGRTWDDIDADVELANFFAKCKVTLQVPGYSNPVDYLVSEGYLARATYRPLFYESGLRLSDKDIERIESELELPQYLLDQLAEDDQRNLSILLKIEELARIHQRIIVFGISVQHSKLLAAVLSARGLSATAVTSETPKKKREKAISEFKDASSETKVLCNYGVLTTGFDAPRTSAAVIARPTKSLVLYSQMVGRAIRGVRAGGNEVAEIVTVVDSDLPGFGSVSEAFNNWEDVWGNSNSLPNSF